MPPGNSAEYEYAPVISALRKLHMQDTTACILPPFALHSPRPLIRTEAGLRKTQSRPVCLPLEAGICYRAYVSAVIVC
jgi:hypothetical protein